MFNDVSETAIITLKSRAIESEASSPVIKDPMSQVCLNALIQEMDEDTYKRIVGKRTSSVLTRHVALRARKYDELSKKFLLKYPDGVIVSLGAGLDTRFWRLGLKPEQYIELDLPEMVATKRLIFGDALAYQLMGQSVLDLTWIKALVLNEASHYCFIAEGLFMYLHEVDVKILVKAIADGFDTSMMVFETVNKRYTKGLNKKMVEMKMKNQLNSEAGSSYNFGLNRGKDIESFHPKIQLSQEWSYFEDPDIRPKFLKYLGRFEMFTRTQWTVVVTF